MGKMSILEAIVAKLNGGDEAKIKQFIDKGTRIATRNIAINKDKINDLKADYADKLDDAKLAAEEVLCTVDVDSIKTTEDRANYFVKYAGDVMRANDAIENLEKELADKVEACQNIIDRNEKLLSLWSDTKIDVVTEKAKKSK